MTMQETNISYIYSYPCPMEGLFIPTCCESNWLNHDFFRFKTEKKENVVDDMFPWKKKWKKSVLATVEVFVC